MRLIDADAVHEVINDIRDCISVEGYCAIQERIKKLPTVCDIDRIREEIEREADHYDAYVDQDIAKGLYYAGEIMDKYTKGKSE